MKINVDVEYTHAKIEVGSDSDDIERSRNLRWVECSVRLSTILIHLEIEIGRKMCGGAFFFFK